jgi:hypothetical protein
LKLGRLIVWLVSSKLVGYPTIIQLDEELDEAAIQLEEAANTWQQTFSRVVQRFVTKLADIYS